MREEAEYGLSIGDVMTALLLIIILVMMNALSTLREESDKSNAFEATRAELNSALYHEFEDDFSRLNLRVDTVNGVIDFSSPDVLFDPCDSEVKNDFKLILQEFYPRYLTVLTEARFKHLIKEVRVEGHTSSDWGGCGGFSCPRDESGAQSHYLCNLKLSQMRSFEVLNFLLEQDEVLHGDWFVNRAVAMGYSSSQRIFNADTRKEDKVASRRVSFRALLDYEQFMVQLD